MTRGWMELVSVCLRGALSADFAGARLDGACFRLRGALSADFAGRDWVELASVCLRGELGADFAG